MLGGYRDDLDPTVRRFVPNAKQEIIEELTRQGLDDRDLHEVFDRLPPRLCEQIHSVVSGEIVLFGGDSIDYDGTWR